MIGLFDDVLTTGAHFRAASAVLKQSFPGVRIVGLFIARRVPEAADIEDFELSGCIALISHAANVDKAASEGAGAPRKAKIRLAASRRMAEAACAVLSGRIQMFRDFVYRLYFTNG